MRGLLGGAWLRALWGRDALFDVGSHCRATWIGLVAFGCCAVLIVYHMRGTTDTQAQPAGRPDQVQSGRCSLQEMEYDVPDARFRPIYPVGGHSGPVRGNYDALFENSSLSAGMCEKWLGGVSGEYQYASQFGQDWWLYNHIFKHYPPGYRGVYVELGAFQPVKESNSYFFDKCLGWEGLCIEPQPVNVAGFVGRRSCTLVPFCVSDRETLVKFVSFKGSYYAGSGLGKVEDAETTELFRRSANASWEQTYEIEIVCFSLKQLFSHYNVRHVDYLSLDVEGYEENAIFGVDFSKVQIDVITIEGSSSGSRAAQYLVERYGYKMVRGVHYDRLALVDFVLVAPGFRGFKCGEKLSRLDTYRSCPPNPNDPPDVLARHTLCRT